MGIVLSLIFIVLFFFLLLVTLGFVVMGKLFGGVDKVLKIARRLIFGNKDTRQYSSSGQSASSGSRRSSAYANNSSGDAEDRAERRQQGKIFHKDEGEYVDFEEIK